MTDFIDNLEYIPPTNDSISPAATQAIESVIMPIIESELTPRQRLCLTGYYVDRKSQKELAQDLGLSQSTVQHHIAAAKQIAGKYIKYCCIAANNATSYLTAG